MNSVDLYGVVDTLPVEHGKYANALKNAAEVFQEALNIYNDPKFESKEDWKKEVQGDVASVYSKHFSYGKAFALRGEIPWKYEDVFESNWREVEAMPEWNSNIAFSRKVLRPTANMDIVHYANNDVLIVKSRDFVVSRLKREIDGKSYLIARSVDLPELPETKERVRGILHLGAGRFFPHPSKPNVTCIDLILSMDLRGFIPKAVVNTVLARLMEKDYEQQLRYFERVRDQKSGIATTNQPDETNDNGA